MSEVVKNIEDNSVQDTSITLRIQNNRPYEQQINFLGNPYNPLDTANAKTEYRWDITALVFSTENSLTIQYRPVSVGAFSLYTIYITQVQYQNPAGVVAALNTLGIGYFTTYTALGSTYIDTNNDDYVFGDINIYDSSVPQVQYTWNTAYAAGMNNIDVNAVNQVSNNNPTTASGVVPVANGDSVHFYGTLGGAISTTLTVYNATTGATLFSDILTPTSPLFFSYTFTAITGNVYQISVMGPI